MWEGIQDTGKDSKGSSKLYCVCETTNEPKKKPCLAILTTHLLLTMGGFPLFLVCLKQANVVHNVNVWDTMNKKWDSGICTRTEKNNAHKEKINIFLTQYNKRAYINGWEYLQCWFTNKVRLQTNLTSITQAHKHTVHKNKLDPSSRRLSRLGGGSFG